MKKQSATIMRRLYYGWLVVGLLCLCSATLIGIAMSSFVMFADPLARAFGWTESQTGGIVSAMWFSAPLALLTAPMVKRFGTWPMVAGGMAIQVIALALVPFTPSFAFLFFVRLMMGFGLVMIIAASPVIVAAWFKKHFATAMALVWAAAAGGQIIFAPFTVFLTENLGWKAACFLLSALLAVPMILAVRFSRGPAAPAAVGQHLDGVHAAQAVLAGDAGEETLGWRDAVRSINWLTCAFMCLAVIGGGITSLAFQSQAPALFGAMRMDAQTTAWMLSIFSLAALVGSAGSGWLLDRSSTVLTTILIGTLVFAGMTLFLSSLGHPARMSAAIATAAIGLGIGACEVLWISLFKRQFGTAAFATTYGIFYFSFQIGMGAGGFFGGIVIERLGAAGLVHAMMLTYIAPIVFALWRPGGLNGQPDTRPPGQLSPEL